MTFWQYRNVLVTGATGFVGSYLTGQLLDAGASVTTIIRDWRPDSLLINGEDFEHINIVKGDLEDRDLVERVLAEYEIDSVFHLAAQTVVTIANKVPYPTIKSNILTTLNVLEAVRQNGHIRHTVIASSDKAYGELSEHKMYREDDPLNGLHPYDCSKSCTDMLAQTYINTYKLPIAITRCGNIYGGGDVNWSRLIPNTIRRILSGKLPEIWGTGEETRDYFYVYDCARAYMLLSQKEAHGAYNFSTGEELTVRRVIDYICNELKVPLQYDTLNHTEGQISYQWLDSSKARRNLGWLPEYEFDKGIKDTVRWYKDYLIGDRP